MKEYLTSQYGWNVVEHNPEQKVYSISENGDVTFLVPEDIWENLAIVRQNASNYRKSRDYFRDARDQEKQQYVYSMSKMQDKHNAQLADINAENQYLMNEVSELERSINFYKVLIWMAGVFSALCLASHFII